MSEILEKIHSRGYWRIIIRPAKFVADRVKYSDLLPILQRIAVQNRSLGFPHIDPYQPLAKDLNWIGYEFELMNFIEAWRFYQSGQFAQRSAMWLDWRDQAGWGSVYNGWKPGIALGIYETVIRFTEIFELASRLALSLGADQVHIETTICNIRDRTLFTENPMQIPFVNKYKTSILEFPYKKDVYQQELISEANHLALEASRELFARFDWNPSQAFLQAMQNNSNA